MGLEKGLKEWGKNVLGSWKKENAPNAERKAWQRSSAVMGKTGNVLLHVITSGHFVEEISGREGSAWTLGYYHKMQQERGTEKQTSPIPSKM